MKNIKNKIIAIEYRGLQYVAVALLTLVAVYGSNMIHKPVSGTAVAYADTTECATSVPALINYMTAKQLSNPDFQAQQITDARKDMEIAIGLSLQHTIEHDEDNPTQLPSLTPGIKK